MATTLLPLPVVTRACTPVTPAARTASASRWSSAGPYPGRATPPEPMPPLINFLTGLLNMSSRHVGMTENPMFRPRRDDGHAANARR